MRRWLVESFDLVRGVVVAQRIVEADSWHDARARFLADDEVSLDAVRFAGGDASVEAYIMTPSLRCTPAP